MSLEDARRLVAGYVEHYNNERLHSALGYVTPKDKLEGREKEVYATRNRKLEEAREARKQRRRAGRLEGVLGANKLTGFVAHDLTGLSRAGRSPDETDTMATGDQDHEV